jgi:hypothetical protein
MQSMVSLSDLTGTWRRSSIERTNGIIDTTTEVWWMQHLDGFFVDWRRPAQRPSFEGCIGWDNCTSEQQQYLLSQQGFSGTLMYDTSRDVWSWTQLFNIHREQLGEVDEGTLQYLDESRLQMQEDALDHSYREIWMRNVADKSFLPHFHCIVGENIHLLADGQRIVRVSPHKEGQLSCDISCCLLTKDDALRVPCSQWKVDASILPWREGQRLLEGESEIKAVTSQLLSIPTQRERAE